MRFNTCILKIVLHIGYPWVLTLSIPNLWHHALDEITQNRTTFYSTAWIVFYKRCNTLCDRQVTTVLWTVGLAANTGFVENRSLSFVTVQDRESRHQPLVLRLTISTEALWQGDSRQSDIIIQLHTSQSYLTIHLQYLIYITIYVVPILVDIYHFTCHHNTIATTGQRSSLRAAKQGMAGNCSPSHS